MRRIALHGKSDIQERVDFNLKIQKGETIGLCGRVASLAKLEG